MTPKPGQVRQSECVHIRIWWATFTKPRYARSVPAGFASDRVEVRVPCQVKGSHGQHQGPGGLRWL